MPGESTARNGNLAKATFNKPSSVAIYDRNETKIREMAALKPVYLLSTNESYWYERLECIYGNAKNFTYISYDDSK